MLCTASKLATKFVSQTSQGYSVDECVFVEALTGEVNPFVVVESRIVELCYQVTAL